MSFADLDGWETDDHARALSVFRGTCRDMKRPDWLTLCRLAGAAGAPKEFFELFFQPVLIGQGQEALFTGYFEPEIEGARLPDARFRYPVYRMPEEAESGDPWLTRREILTGEVMKDRGLEIAWVDDPVDLYFLQIQGSGRIRLRDGSTLRIGYGGSNGQPYRAVGPRLVEMGALEPHQLSARMIRDWIAENGDEGADLLLHNPSYVFFREIDDLAPDKGPRGAMNRSLTGLRSIAVDPAFTRLGSPVWIEKEGAAPIRRLMIAQDTGGVIKGPQRADIFFGTGDAAGTAAGRIRDPGRMVVLMPIQHAHALLPEHLQ